MSGLESHGRQFANGRLWPRLDGKVTIEQFIIALRNIGHDKLADKIEGLLLLLMMQVCHSLFCYCPSFTVTLVTGFDTLRLGIQ